uniref:Uncharacterized protein n=1 Tax=Arundo donax TaxID=35708 RepID=A0A0A9EG44_ARUDO
MKYQKVHPKVHNYAGWSPGLQVEHQVNQIGTHLHLSQSHQLWLPHLPI